MPLDADTTAVISSLHDVGVDFSIPRSSLVDFLGNAEFTPYPALAEALLRSLKGRGLRLPVFIDVIVFNYEHSPGNPHHVGSKTLTYRCWRPRSSRASITVTGSKTPHSRRYCIRREPASRGRDSSLHDVGVDFSIPDLRWSTSSATPSPVPGVGRALLRSLKGRGLRLPVYRDTRPALVGRSCVGISANGSSTGADIAHEIGHLITNSDGHSTEPDNVLNDPGGPRITDGQAELARTWARISPASGSTRRRRRRSSNY